MKYVIAFMFTLIILGCSNEKNNTNNIAKNENLIKPTEIFIKEPIDPARMVVLNNYLFVSCFSCTPMIYVFSTPKLELINSFGTQGQGPDEFNNFVIFGAGSEEYLYIWGCSNSKQINQYKVLNNGDVALHNKINMNKLHIFNNFHLVKDSFILYNEIPETLSIKKMSLYDPEKVGHIYFEQNQKAVCFDENFGNLAASSNGIAYLYQYKDRIDFFDLDFNLKRTVENKKNKTSSINQTPQGFGENVIYYAAYYSGQKSLYVLYKGFSLLSPQNRTSNILEYDWEGNKIAEYHLDAAISIFAVDESSKKIIGYHPNKQDVFLCFDLK
ncbi:hypothetical protein FACS189455_4580 [Bacteroidia bacterium]|nr:hypothetical protein FACS189455_4580 [Bacteroidia bacterium]